MNQLEIINLFNLNKKQKELFDQYILELIKYNKHTNLVGKSTLIDPWKSHILDCLQILPLINNKKTSILDMGTGAGLPGILFSILGFSNVTLVDSNRKKTYFLKTIKKEMNLSFNIILNRLEKIDNIKFDLITSRALANLEKLITYSQKFLKKNTVLVFLKGKTVNDELISAKKKWNFQYEKHKSLSDQRGCILVIKDIKKI